MAKLFNNSQQKILNQLGLMEFDWASADDDAFEKAYELVEDSMLSEGRIGDALNDYGEDCRGILNAVADL